MLDLLLFGFYIFIAARLSVSRKAIKFKFRITLESTIIMLCYQ